MLNILAGRLSPGSGEILLNGTKLNKKVKKKICYVLQEDIFFAHLTLQETLTVNVVIIIVVNDYYVICNIVLFHYNGF